MRRGTDQVDQDRRGHVPTERLEVARRADRPRIDVIPRLAETLEPGLALGVTIQRCLGIGPWSVGYWG